MPAKMSLIKDCVYARMGVSKCVWDSVWCLWECVTAAKICAAECAETL